MTSVLPPFRPSVPGVPPGNTRPRLPHPPKPANLKHVRIETPVGHPLRPLMTTTTPAPTTSDVEQLARLARAVEQLRTQVARRIVGQQEAVDGILTAILAGGHALLIGVPGLAKTLMVSTVAEALKLSFNRVQFTPDLMPSDITGTEIIEEDLTTGKRAFRFVHGPIFANVVLADEINRTPPKTQAALLQAMQEHQVTVGGQTYHLPEPFFVLATQNPIEQEGTYPLPEAQLDRFMLELRVGYPDQERGRGDRRADHRRPGREARAGARRRDRARHAGPGAADPGVPAAGAGRGDAGADDPARCRGAGLRPGVRGVGRRSARLAVPGARRQGAGRAGRPPDGRSRRRARGGAVGAAAPGGHQLRGRGGRPDQRRCGAGAVERRGVGGLTVRRLGG